MYLLKKLTKLHRMLTMIEDSINRFNRNTCIWNEKSSSIKKEEIK